MTDSAGIVRELRARIASSEFLAGDALPELGAIGEQYDADDSTVRHALHELQREGVLSLSLVAVVNPPK